MTNHKKLIDVTASLDWKSGTAFPSHKRRYTVLKIDQSVKMPRHKLSRGVAWSKLSAPVHTGYKPLVYQFYVTTFPLGKKNKGETHVFPFSHLRYLRNLSFLYFLLL